MLKAAGSVLVLGATVLFGFGKAAELREQYAQTAYIRQLFCWIQSEIRYARSPLGEIFTYVGRNAKEPYGTWLLKLGRRLIRREDGMFADIWKTSIREELETCALSKEELARLEELGDRLGLADITMQIKTLDLYLERIEISMNEIQGEMKTKVRLYHCLGIMGGLLIVTLLL